MKRLQTLHLFAGAGGGIIADMLPWRITEQPAKRRFLSRSIHAHLPLTGTEQVYQVTQKDHQAEGSGYTQRTGVHDEAQ